MIELRPDRVVIGRSPDCHIVIDDKGVSRRHAEIYQEGERVFLRDLSSRNTTRVNNVKVFPGIDHRLSPGDRIKVGGAEFMYYLSDNLAGEDVDAFRIHVDLGAPTRPTDLVFEMTTDNLEGT